MNFPVLICQIGLLDNYLKDKTWCSLRCSCKKLYQVFSVDNKIKYFNLEINRLETKINRGERYYNPSLIDKNKILALDYIKHHLQYRLLYYEFIKDHFDFGITLPTDLYKTIPHEIFQKYIKNDGGEYTPNGGRFCKCGAYLDSGYSRIDEVIFKYYINGKITDNNIFRHRHKCLDYIINRNYQYYRIMDWYNGKLKECDYAYNCIFPRRDFFVDKDY